MQISSSKLYFLPYLLLGLVWLAGAFVGIMDVDAAQYAAISRQMLDSGSYLEVLDRYRDYLDKPPLLFWLSALSFKIFGIGLWQYRLPSIFFGLAGLWATGKLTERYYGQETGKWAWWILATTQAWILTFHDVRTDTILCASVILSVYHLLVFAEENRRLNFWAGSIFLACAMLTKGPIGLMAPGLALAGHFIITRQYKLLFKPEWLWVLPVLALLLSPMTYGLYTQHGWKGVRFFYWTQSFGRLTGENEWRNDVYFLFLAQNWLWAFLPWTIFGGLAFIWGWGKLLKNRFKLPSNHLSGLNIIGFSLVYVALAQSKYQLPHYLFVVFPFLAIQTAIWFKNLNWETIPKPINAIRYFLMLGLTLTAIALGTWAFPAPWYWVMIGVAIWVGVLTLFNTPSRPVWNFIGSLGFLALGVNLFLNAFTYPQLLKYQSSSEVVNWMEGQNLNTQKLIGYRIQSYSMDFACKRVVVELQKPEELLSLKSGDYIFIRQGDLQVVMGQNRSYKKLKEFEHFHVTMLTLPFLNPSTRSNNTEKRVLIEII